MAATANDAKASTVAKTFFCVWPDHKIHLGKPTPLMRDDGSRLMIYDEKQTVRFQDQRFTATTPEQIVALEEECKRQPTVFSEKWIPNPYLSRRDDLSPSHPNVSRGLAQ